MGATHTNKLALYKLLFLMVDNMSHLDEQEGYTTSFGLIWPPWPDWDTSAYFLATTSFNGKGLKEQEVINEFLHPVMDCFKRSGIIQCESTLLSKNAVTRPLHFLDLVFP